MIRKLQRNDAEAACALLFAAGRALFDSGIDQWDELYPNRDDVEYDISRGEMHGLFSDGVLEACIVLNRHNDEEYKTVSFTGDDGTALTIHRLAVKPESQGMGFAGSLLVFAEDFAAALGFDSIRLDVFSLNPKALNLYAGRGYLRRGSVRFRKGIFHLYEKSIEHSGQGLFEAVSGYSNSADNPVDLLPGTVVLCHEESDPDGDWPDWIRCSFLDSEAWIPAQIIRRDGDSGLITEKYCNREFDLIPGEYVLSKKMLNGWVWGYKAGYPGTFSWAPLNCLKKIHPY